MRGRLDSLHNGANVALFGASGGIGRAVLDNLQRNDRVGKIHAFSRRAIEAACEKTDTALFDLHDEQTIAAAARTASQEGPLDLVFIATGILHRGDSLRPEKSMRELDAEAMQEVFRINTIGPALIAKHCLPQMRRGHKTVFAALSARVGSISDNRLGGWASYRASKAALNMLLRTLAVEQTRRAPESIVVGLHPGTVATELSAPFTSRVPAERLFETERAARQLLDVVDGLGADETGGVFAWDGSRIDY